MWAVKLNQNLTLLLVWVGCSGVALQVHHHLQRKDFGPDFWWGVAISAAQNEGAAFTDGRGASIWDKFAARPGKIKNGDRPTQGVEFYQRYPQDIALAGSLGFNAFRFSISWSRILPDGMGSPVAAGLLFYHRVIDACLQMGLEPMIMLYHWDLPWALQKEGGWAHPLMPKWFHRFVDICTKEYGHKVKYWMVLNEPMGFTSLGYMLGKHAPGKTDLKAFLMAIHNATLCQAEGGRQIRAAHGAAQIGTCFSCSEVFPYSATPLDLAAAQRLDILLNRLFLEPSLGRGYPEMEGFALLDKLHLHTKAWKYVRQMQFNFDFIGVQNYFPLTVKYQPLVPYVQAIEVKAKDRKVPHTAMGWEINGESCYRMLKRFWHYGSVRALFVTECGAAFPDKMTKGLVEDPERIAYFQEYLSAVWKAKKEGVDIRGFLAWTLTDNFEWAEGFSAKFGLVHVDRHTQKRTPKASALWFRDFLLAST